MVGPERIGALTASLVAAWQGRPDGAAETDEAFASGLWWGIVEPCDPGLRAGCLAAADELFGAAGVGRPPTSRWADLDLATRVAGYHRGAALVGREGQGDGPEQLPEWAVG